MDKIKNKKIYNHYVPQFLLKQFSDNQKSISMYLKDKQKYVSNASIGRVAGCEYLYGENCKFEDWFCCIEGNASEIIKNICKNEKIPNNKNVKEFLYAFLLISETRTKEMADNYTRCCNDIIKNYIKYGIMTGHPDFIGLSVQDIDKIKVSINIPNLDLVKSSIKISKNIKDLKMILIINKTNKSFVISDCPVVKYNLYLKDCININSYGWYQKGILAFLPISNDCVIGLIDTQIYKIKSLKNGRIFISDEKQIYELNKLFALQAENYIFFNQSIKSEYIESLLKETPKINKFDFSKLMITNLSVKSIKNKINISFLKMKVKPLKGQYHNHSDYYRKKTIPHLYGSKEKYKQDKKINYNRIFKMIETSVKSKEEQNNV